MDPTAVDQLTDEFLIQFEKYLEDLKFETE